MDSSALSQRYYNRALYFLSPRPRSEKEIREKLQKKPRGKKAVEINLEIIEEVINKLKAQNLINDTEFAQWWIEQRTVFRPKGIRVIKMELRQKGISEDIIKATINPSALLRAGSSQLTVSNEIDRAKKLVKKRIDRYKNLPKQEIYQKLSQFLAYRGFDYDIISDVLKEVN